MGGFSAHGLAHPSTQPGRAAPPGQSTGQEGPGRRRNPGMMAATRRRSRRAPTRKASAKRGSSRAAPRQPRAPRAPLLAPGQGKDLAGLALLVFGAFTAFTLWSAGHGAFASDGLRAALRVSVGEGSTLVPLLALAAGLALLLKVEATRVRPFRTGAMLLTAGLLLALSGSSLVRTHVRAEGG